MRDIALTLILIGVMPVFFKRPIIGALMFAPISLANPHPMTWDSPTWAMARRIHQYRELGYELLPRDCLDGNVTYRDS